ncbi:A disintegrin and metalloproteinase with thrombospondin motifs 1-like [Phymastichus coffea]|uniref:A disintegrin and metalloproteinase with thrombospondin motifs 1-like n=1 Tax=Phymastichus coffea TaxID=108790 RepID=UPI00273BEB43|nr:A disintegrin and metalloproteinase with thrombospondin motifs 1-like [Phymastichus coffea]
MTSWLTSSLARVSIVLLHAIVLADADAHGHQVRRYPRIVHPRVIPRAELSRDRRSAADAPAPTTLPRDVQFVSLSEWILRTEPNRQLTFSPRFGVEWRGTRASSAGHSHALDSCDIREGSIHGLEATSRVILTSCNDQFFGMVNLDNRTYFVEPLMANGSEHLLYEAEFSRTRRESTSSSATPLIYEANRRFYNLSGDTFHAENYEDSPELLLEHSDLGRNNQLQENVPGAEDDDGVEYFYGKSWPKEKLPTRNAANEYSTPKWLELAIAADYSVIDFHGVRVQQYILALLNIVSSIYKDPTLDSNMQLVVVRMIFYTDKKDGMVQHGNARRSLENVNKWNRKLLDTEQQQQQQQEQQQQVNGSTRHDVAVWLTRLDIGGPSGYAPVSGACDPARSCALNRDEGLTSAFIIAHEVAHILGLSHDGDKNAGNSCAKEAARGSIMAPMVAATFHNFHWSTCSRKEFHGRAKHWSCLGNEPRASSAENARNSPHMQMFSMDDQCRMEFGEGYGRCRSTEPAELCAHLWCGRANDSLQPRCKTKKGPPIEGTLCAENKWCIDGVCEAIDQQQRHEPTPLAVRGRAAEHTWAAWDPWGECSRTCGLAVQHRTRHCSGSCEGDSKEYRVCEQPACPEPVDPRARQCSRFFELRADSTADLFDNNGTWLPYEDFDGSPDCQLVCYRKETGEIFHTGLDVEDAAPCSYETTDICLGGTCRPMGCDGVLDSGRARDVCGVCSGDNSTCENFSDKFQRKLRRETTRLTVVPRAAYNVKVVVTILLMDAVPHEGNVKIVMRDAERRRHEMGEFDADGRAAVTVVGGAAFRLERLAEKYVLWSRGPVASSIVVSFIASRVIVRTGASVAASWQYTLSRSESNVEGGRFAWYSDGPWGPCSVSCGGGIRRKQLLCQDELTGELVSRRKCLLVLKPPGRPDVERCNTHSCDLEYTWIPGMWERCNLASASSCVGKQQRRIYCVRSVLGEHQVTRENELRVYRNTVLPARCRGQSQPPTRRECTRSAQCAGHWIYADWSPVRDYLLISQCSQSCGRGVQVRKARCVRGSIGRSRIQYQHLLLDSCNATYAPDETRVCKGFARHSPECGGSRCRKDKSQFCVEKDLISYCRNAAFRRRCCVSCRSV